jgi:hypothetical protein
MDCSNGTRLVSRRRSASLGAVVVLALAGCGGVGTTKLTRSVTTAPRSSSASGAARLIAKADAICRQVNHELAAGPQRLEGPQIAVTALHNAALERRAVAELSRLTPPGALARDWRQIIAYRQSLAEALAKLGHYAKANDVQRMLALSTSKKQAHQKLSKLASRAGFKDCSRVGTPRSAAPPLLAPFPTRPAPSATKL